MTHSERDKLAITTILQQMGDATYPDIALRGGEGLASPLMEMVCAGEVIKEQDPSRPVYQQTRYRLANVD